MARAPSRLSTRMAANDVTGLTDSLRGGLHIEHVGGQSGAGSLAVSLCTVKYSGVRTNGYIEEREREGGRARESGRTDTD